MRQIGVIHSQRLFPVLLLPTQRPPCPQIIELLLPMGPQHACGVGVTLATAVSFIWVNKFNASKNRVMGGGLALRWPPISSNTQQLTESWRPRQVGCWNGGSDGVERVGTIRMAKINEKMRDLGLRWPPFRHGKHNNQPQIGVHDGEYYGG